MRLKPRHPAVAIMDGELVPAANTDLAQPQQAHQVQPPPEEDETVQHIAEILLAGYAIKRAAAALAAIMPGIPLAVWMAALRNVGGTKGHAAHARTQSLQLNQGSRGANVASSAARREIFYRAAYLFNSVHRINDRVNAGSTLPAAVEAERPVFSQHEAARKRRLDAAAKVGRAANMFGNLLGWYLDPLLNNEPECIAASGNNFYADESTVIGDPGAVHLHCGCTAGPPHENGEMVNDALTRSGAVIFMAPRKFNLRKRAG